MYWNIFGLPLFFWKKILSETFCLDCCIQIRTFMLKPKEKEFNPKEVFGFKKFVVQTNFGLNILFVLNHVYLKIEIGSLALPLFKDWKFVWYQMILYSNGSSSDSKWLGLMGGWWCKVIFMSNTSFVMLGWGLFGAVTTDHPRIDW